MKRPSFQFYPGDWQSNSNLRRCSHAEKGVWLDVLCLLHDQPEYGVLRWPLKEIAQAVGSSVGTLRGIVSKGVLKGDDKLLEAPFIYTPRSARKDGDPVTLVPPQEGPIWYSSRMVKDEYVRTIRGEGTRFGDESGEALKHSPKPPFGDGPSSSSSSSASALNTSNLPVATAFPEKAASADLLGDDPEKPRNAEVPDCPHKAVLALWAEVMPDLPQHLKWTETRSAHLRSRWRETAVEKSWPDTEAGLAYLRRLFLFVRKSDFLMGKSRSTDPNRKPFVIELEWLLKPQNWAKTIEGKYHEQG